MITPVAWGACVGSWNSNEVHVNAQMAINMLTMAALFGMITTAFRAGRRVLGYVPLHNGAVFALGGYGAVIAERAGMSLAAGAFLSAVGCAVVSVLVDRFVLGGLSEARRRTEAPLVAGFGLLIFTASGLAVAFKRQNILIGAALRFRTIAIGDGAISMPKLLMLICGAMAVAIVQYVQTTSIGRHERAVESDPELAYIRGLNVQRIRAWTAAWTGLLCGVAGVLAGIERNVVPDIGLDVLLVGVIGATSALLIPSEALIVACALAFIGELAAETVGEGWQVVIYGVACYAVVFVRHRRSTWVKT